MIKNNNTHIDIEVIDNIYKVKMNFHKTKNFNIELIEEIHHLLNNIYNTNEQSYFIFSGTNDIYNLGGDLKEFYRSIKEKDYFFLEDYASKCILLINKLLESTKNLTTTIAVVNGTAAGGGIESFLAADIIIAFKNKKLSFPEIKYGFYPGMGAFELLNKKVGFKQAKEIIISNKVYTTDYFYELGIIDYLIEEEELDSFLNNLIKKESKNQFNINAMRLIEKRLHNVSLMDLKETTDLWVNTIKNIPNEKLKLMKKIIDLQDKL